MMGVQRVVALNIKGGMRSPDSIDVITDVDLKYFEKEVHICQKANV